MALNDAMMSALGALGYTGTLNDRLLGLFSSEGGGTLNDAERAWLFAQGVTGSGTNNDLWMEYLGGLGFTGALNDRLLQFWENSGPAAVPNILLNSSWVGLAGSVAGADFVAPNDWTTGFWPPDVAAAEARTGYNALHLECTANRGFVSITVPSDPLIGKRVNLSAYIDQFVIGTNQRPVHIAGGATEIEKTATVTGDGRYFAVYEVVGNALQVRIGAGTTANEDMNWTISRPQLTEGEGLRPYQPT